MGARISERPLTVLLMGCGSLAMLFPAIHALVIRDFATSRAFFYAFLLFSLITFLVGLATASHKSAFGSRGQFVSLVGAFVFLPMMLAVPVYQATTGYGFLDVWFEMVSDLTTTGATLFDNPRDIPRSVHLWRAIVGWLGGLMTWIMALTVFAPLSLGGFEVRAGHDATSGARFAQIGKTLSPAERLQRYTLRFTPLYFALTLVLWMGLTAAGEIPFVALCHAMSVMATSGISPVGGIYYSAAGFWGEALIALFFVFALCHISFAGALPGEGRQPLLKDRELKIGLGVTAVLTLFLVMGHLAALTDPTVPGGLMTGLRAAWGAFFTILSFLTTTGFESADWAGTRIWSSVGTPGLILVGVAAMGGGVATTAGGIKLLRVYALYKHSRRELERLVHPSSVAGAGAEARRVRREGAQIAWIFFMLFAISIAVVMLLLSLTGVQFETAMVLAISALSTTGPLAEVAAEAPISYAGLTDISKIVLAVAMILGRLETLAIIALLNPEFWRR